jgi:hypothetical protein
VPSASFWIGGFVGEHERFELKGQVLRHGRTKWVGSSRLKRTILTVNATCAFWKEIDEIGCWAWSGRFFSDVLDGVQWTLKLRNGARALDLSGSNAFPPAGTLDQTVEFKQLIGAFRTAAGQRDRSTGARP